MSPGYKTATLSDFPLDCWWNCIRVQRSCRNQNKFDSLCYHIRLFFLRQPHWEATSYGTLLTPPILSPAPICVRQSGASRGACPHLAIKKRRPLVPVPCNTCRLESPWFTHAWCKAPFNQQQQQLCDAVILIFSGKKKNQIFFSAYGSLS